MTIGKTLVWWEPSGAPSAIRTPHQPDQKQDNQVRGDDRRSLPESSVCLHSSSVNLLRTSGLNAPHPGETDPIFQIQNHSIKCLKKKAFRSSRIVPAATTKEHKSWCRNMRYKTKKKKKRCRILSDPKAVILCDLIMTTVVRRRSEQSWPVVKMWRETGHKNPWNLPRFSESSKLCLAGVQGTPGLC